MAKKKSQMTITANDFNESIQALFDEFGDEVEYAMEEAMRLTSLDVVKELEKGGSYNGGEEYNRGWDSKQVKKGYTVYNANKPGLAHLLEFGHAKQNGGRTRAFTHIAPVNDDVGNKLTKRFEELL